MNYLDPSEYVLVPLLISVRADSAKLLTDLAAQMGVSIDELIGVLAEDSVIDLAKSENLPDQVAIPSKCSTKDLVDILNGLSRST